MQDLNPRARLRLTQIRDGLVPYPPMWETVPLKLLDFAAGAVRMETQAERRHINALDTVHGGFVATVLDTVLGLAVFTVLGEHDSHTTIDLAIKMLKRVPLATPLVAASRLVHVSASLGVSEATLCDAAGTVYAHGTTTCLLRRRSTA